MSPDFPPADDEGLRAAARRALRELPDAPDAMVRRAEALGAPRPARSGPSLLRRLQAALSVDSWAGAVPALRGAGATRQLLFAAAEHDIDLRIVPVGATWSIEGQLLGPDEQAQVRLARADGTAMPWMPLDGLGSFRIDGLSPGRYRLEVHLAASIVELPALDVGPLADG